MYTSEAPWARQPDPEPTPADQQRAQGPYAALYGRPQQSAASQLDLYQQQTAVQEAGGVHATAPWGGQQWQGEQPASAQQAPWQGGCAWGDGGQAWQQQVCAARCQSQHALHVKGAAAVPDINALANREHEREIVWRCRHRLCLKSLSEHTDGYGSVVFTDTPSQHHPKGSCLEASACLAILVPTRTGYE